MFKNAKQGLSIINALLIINSSQTRKSQGESGLAQSRGEPPWQGCYEGHLSASPLQGSLAFIFSSHDNGSTNGLQKGSGQESQTQEL